MKLLVFNGWASGYEAWSLCTFAHDWLFSYLEQLDGMPERVMAETESAILVGWSMGGSTALRMALKYPEKIRGLVLVATTARMMEDRATHWAGMSLHRRAALKLGTRLSFADDPSPLYAEENLDRGLDYLQQTDLRDQLLELAASGRAANWPVILFQSERDGIVRPPNVDFLKAVFPQAQVVRVPGGEHVLPILIPEQIDQAVRDVITAATTSAKMRSKQT